MPIIVRKFNIFNIFDIFSGVCNNENYIEITVKIKKNN